VRIFDDACAIVGAALAPGVRNDILDEASASSSDLRTALRRLGDGMRAHTFRAGSARIALDRVIPALDNRTLQDGFSVLHDWHGPSRSFVDEIIPLEVLRFVSDARGGERVDRAVLAILLDYYFSYLLALLSLRVWDAGDPNANLDRLSGLLAELQGPHGSGQPFVSDAETLILIATAHYEPDEHGYPLLLSHVRTLDRSHRTRVGLGHAASMGAHLRFGFEVTYTRDFAKQRADNMVDYPWLSLGLVAAMREYARLRDAGTTGAERDRMVEAVIGGLTADAGHFVKPPRPGERDTVDGAERVEFVELFQQHRADLVEEFERFRPSSQRYSPISFFFNFSHNILKGTVVDALLRGEPWRISFNDLLTDAPCGDDAGRRSKETLARTLMGYARANPDTIGGRLLPVVVYDAAAGRSTFGAAMRVIKNST